jgi:hypothetical protein
MLATAGNWREFDSFCWYDRPDDADGFAIVYTHNRDSGLEERANAVTIAKALEPYPDDALPQRHNHWACGWVDGYAVRGRALEVWNELQAQLADYPILDEWLYCDMFAEECDRAYESWARDQFRRELTKRRAAKLDNAAIDKLWAAALDRAPVGWCIDADDVYIDCKDIARRVPDADLIERL